MAEPATPDKLVPEWGLDGDRQVVVVGTIVGLLMLFGVLGYAGFSVFDTLFGGDNTAQEESARSAASQTGTAASGPSIDLSPVRNLASEAGLDADVSMSGTTAVLSGNVPLEADRQLLSSAAGSVEGVEGVDDRLVVLAPELASSVAAAATSAGEPSGEISTSMSGYTAVLEGVVTDDAARAGIVDAAAGLDGVDGVDDRLVVFSEELDAAVAASPWQISADADGRDVELAGLVPTAGEAESTVDAFAAIDGVGSVNSDLRLLAEEVDAALASAALPTVAASVDGYEVSLSGTVADTASRNDVVASIEMIEGVAKVDADLVDASESLDSLGLTKLDSTLSGTSVELSGFVPTQGDLDGAVEVASALPGVSDVDSSAVAVLEDDVRSALSLGSSDSVDISLDGYDVRISGTVASEQRASDLTTALSAVAGIDTITNDLDVAPSTLEVDLNELVDLEPILFETGSAVIEAQSLPTLDRAVELLVASPQGEVTIEGHTDGQGASETNLSLSLDRAQAVADYLVANGVQRDRLIVVGYGEEQPRETNDTPEGRAANRRIEFKIG